jgi:hypothetical protein
MTPEPPKMDKIEQANSLLDVPQCGRKQWAIRALQVGQREPAMSQVEDNGSDKNPRR